MRAIRALSVLAALIAVDTGTAAAQSTRGFRDSWFWGVKGGGMFYQVMSDQVGGSLAPIAGLDWMITRTEGGLYVSYDRAFFDQFVIVNDSVHPDDACPTAARPQCRRVTLDGMHRVTVAGMLFPLQTVRIQPYVGFGVSISHLANPDPDTQPYRNQAQLDLVASTVREFRTAATPTLIVGTQLRLLMFSAFGQVTVTPANQNFFLYTGSNWRTTVAGGLRYNAGSSRDRMR